MCAKDDLVRRKGLLSTSTQTPNYVDTFGLDFAFLFANILSLIAFIISHRPFADELVYALRDVAAWLVYVTIGNLSCEARRQRLTPSTLLAKFIPTTKIRDPLLKSQVYYYCIGKLLLPLENAAKSRILLACADGRIRQYYLTICAILADYEEQVLLTSVKKNRHCTRCTLQQERCLNKGHDDFVHPVNCFGWKHHNFNIHVSLATDTLHLLLKGLTSTEQKAIIQQLVAVVSPLFVSKAPFALHFIRAVCDLVTLAQYKSHDEDTLAYIQGALERINVFKEEFRVYQQTLGEEKNFNYPKWHAALDSICTRANSEAHHITIVKQFYSITNKKEYILQICLHNSQRTALLAADYATIPHSIKLPLSKVAANIAISDFIHAAAVFVSRMSVQIYPSIKCWRSSGKRHNDPKHCDEEVHRDNRRQSRTVTDGRVVAQLHLILTIINYTRYNKDGKHIAYIKAFSKVLLFNNNRQIDNTTRMLTFKFYDLSTIIRLVHLVLRDLPNLTTRTTMSYYVNNYINWDEYNRLYSPTFDIDLLRTLQEYQQKRTRNN
ncbi:hypothetical protein HBI46_038730 [Parastagonospora nodorum]|nr:hypothetical protein HBI46_038730 [Parastagonospora nodorum]